MLMKSRWCICVLVNNMRKVDIDFSLISDNDKSNKLIDDIIAKLG